MNFILVNMLFMTMLFFLNSVSPLMMALILIWYSIIVGVVSWVLLSKWSMMAIILIFLGGMMIVFLYAVTINPNYENMKINYNFFFTFLLFFMSVSLIQNQLFNYNWENNINYPSQSFSNLNFMSLFILTIYLLLTLFIVVKISEGFKGAVMKKF